jgi:hypothetical protein
MKGRRNWLIMVQGDPLRRAGVTSMALDCRGCRAFSLDPAWCADRFRPVAMKVQEELWDKRSREWAKRVGAPGRA